MRHLLDSALKRLFAVIIVVAACVGGWAAFTPDTYPVIDFMAYPGANGDGVSDNSAAFAATFQAAQHGGLIRMPCGTFMTTNTPIANVVDKARFAFHGSGSDCTTILVTGSVNGPTINLLGGNASIDVEGMTIATTSANTQTALTTSLTNGTGTTFGPTNTMEDVFFRPSDMYQAGASVTWWAVGWNNIGVNNWNVFGGGCSGGNAAAINANNHRTICNQLAGSGFNSQTSSACAPSTGIPGCYSVVTNFFGFIASGCDAAIQINDWYQGLSAINVNATVCNRGVYQSLVSPVGALTELQVIGGQWANVVANIQVNDTTFGGLYVNGALIDVVSGTGIIVNGTQYAISANTIACNVPQGTIGISIAGTSSQGGTIGNNVFPGSCGEAIDVAANANTSASISDNHFISNGYASFTAKIDNGSGSAGTTLTVSGYTAVAPLTLNACLLGTGVVNGTCITALGSGTGGNGTYTVNTSQLTPGSGTETMTVFWTGPSSFDYVLHSGSTNTTIVDHEHRIVSQAPACDSRSFFSEFTVLDSTTATFNAAIVGGGTNSGKAFCSASVGGYALH